MVVVIVKKLPFGLKSEQDDSVRDPLATIRSLYAFIRERGKKPFFPLDPQSRPDGNFSPEGNVETDNITESYAIAEDPESIDDTQPVIYRNTESRNVNDKSARVRGVCDTTDNFDITKDPEPYRIRVMSWNIDGKHLEGVRARVQGICDTINKYREEPHVVLLQEVVMEAQQILCEKCPSYDLAPAGDKGYYTAILLRKDVTTLEDNKVIPFCSSKMDRNLLYVKCTVKGIKFDILTSHLESTKKYAEERKKQLKFAFDYVKLADIDTTVIFGGDLNLRDYEAIKNVYTFFNSVDSNPVCMIKHKPLELNAIGGLPEDVDDIWEVTGKRPEAEFTWDVQYNDNLEWSRSARYKPRCRFDRLYIRHSKPTAIVKPVYFELVGLERLQSCQKFPSDHWGLLSHFNVPSRMLQAT